MIRISLTFLLVIWLTATDMVTATATDVEATIIKISRISDPVTSPYSDALIAAQVKIHGVSDQKKTTLHIPQKCLVLFRGFIDRKATPESKYRPGDKLTMQLIRLEDAGQRIQETQIIDEIENFDLDTFFARQSKPIEKFTLPARKPSAPLLHAVLDQEFSDGRSAESRAMRKQQIADDLAALDTRIVTKGGLRQWYVQQQKLFKYLSDPKHFKQNKWLGKYYVSTPVRLAQINVLMTKEPVKGEVPSLKGARQLQAFLDKRGVDLMIVVIPNAYELSAPCFYPGKLPQGEELSPYRIQVLRQFLANNIEVIDPYAEFCREQPNY